MKWAALIAWFGRHVFCRRLLWLFIALVGGFSFFWGLIQVGGLPARRVAAFAFVIIWFFHLVVGVGAGIAIWKIWPERRNKFVEFTAIHLNSAMVDALVAIVLLFMAQNVRFTWKFSIVMFAGAFLRDVFRVPLIFYVIRGPGAHDDSGEEASGSRSVDQWRFDGHKLVVEGATEAIRETIKPEYLKAGASLLVKKPERNRDQ